MEEKILNYDNHFSISDFKIKVENIWKQLLLSIMMKDMLRIKSYVSESLFVEYNNYVEKLIQNNYTRMYELLTIDEITLNDFKVVDDLLEIKFLLKFKVFDYILNQKGDIIQGQNQMRVQKETMLTFTKDIAYTKLKRCPSCGGIIGTNKDKCAYCDRVFETNYILDAIEDI